MTHTALVTGGSRGIGRAISIALKEAGHDVIASYGGNDDAAKAFTDETGIPAVKFDAGDYQSCEKAVEELEKDHDTIDILINNAGITRDRPVHKMSVEEWEAVMRTNLESVFNLTHIVFPGMRERGYGRIINISSLNGQKGQFGQSNYSAAKAGMIGFSKSIALEGAAKGITCNVIAPGYVATEMVKAVPEDVLNKHILPHIPVGRLGEPEEIARCVVFLADEQAGFITGSTLSVNGGQYMI